jgi:hypothetical protein
MLKRLPLSLVLAGIAALSQMATPARQALACSMCQCGDPSYRLMGDAFFASQPWRFSLDLDRYGKDQAAESDPALRETERERRLTLAAAWNPRPGLRLVGRLPLTARAIESGAERQTLTGLGDPDLFAHLRVAGDARRWLAVMAGVRTAWGQNERRVDGVRADEHLQPGTGAVAGSAGLAAAVDFGGGRHLFASAMGRTSGTNAHGYRYGDAVMATLAAQRDLGAHTAGVLQLDARSAGPDHEHGAAIENSGGDVLYVAPRVQFAASERLVLKLGVQVPIAQRLRGDQVERTNLLGGVSIAF